MFQETSRDRLETEISRPRLHAWVEVQSNPMNPVYGHEVLFLLVYAAHRNNDICTEQLSLDVNQ